MVHHDLAKFGGHRYCSSRDKLFLVCHHVFKQDYVIKEAGDYNDSSHSRLVSILSSLVAIDTMGVEI